MKIDAFRAEENDFALAKEGMRQRKGEPPTMSNTLYAAFNDATLAEKAAGALLDHGVRAEDLSLVQHESRYNMPSTVAEDTGVTPIVEGEMTGATMDSPGVAGVGNYTQNVAETTPPISNNGPYADNTEVNYIADREAMTPHTAAETYMEEDDFATARNQADYDRETHTVDHHDHYKNPTDEVIHSEKAAKGGISTTTGADAGSAAITGGAWGLGVGAVAALASLLIPGVGLVVGGGALATAIAGLVATTGAGAAVGAVTGYLKDQGVEEHVAQKYGDTVEHGGAILAVHVPSNSVDEPLARQLLDKYGATNINSYEYTAVKKPYMA